MIENFNCMPLMIIMPLDVGDNENQYRFGFCPSLSSTVNLIF
jgi:hypothetical protein